MKLIELSGKKFGRLTVIEKDATSKPKSIKWICKCDCGTIKSIAGDALKGGGTRSCGCWRREFGSWNRGKVGIEHHGYKGIGSMSASHYNAIRYKAGKRRLEFSVSHEYLWHLFEKQEGRCAISGIPIRFDSYNRAHDATASLDRIKADFGYIEGNVQWVFQSINFMKGRMSDSQFIEVCKLVAEYNR